MTVYSVVIPVYNEVDALPELQRRLACVLEELDGDAQVIVVDDGSTDGTFELAEHFASQDERFSVVQLSRNFGHQVAISAGIDFAEGDAVITMDGDLQHPPEVIPRLVASWREGYELVYAKRVTRAGEPLGLRIAARMFYRLLGRIASVEVIAEANDFRLIDRSVANAFRALPERVRYVRGMFSWVGFRHTFVEYAGVARPGGRPRYTTGKRIALALSGIVGFSDVPLRVILAFGFVVSIASFLAGITALVVQLSGGHTVPGWASMLVTLSFLGGVQLIMLGMIGVYVARVFEEVKQRPIYVVRTVRGLAARPRNLSTERAVPLGPSAADR